MGAPEIAKDLTEHQERRPSHVEFGLSHDHMAAHVEYDNRGIAGVLRSPYVFGAAALASMGGFSFGYGESVMSNCVEPSLTDVRSGCYLPHSRYASVSRTVPRDGTWRCSLRLQRRLYDWHA